jgi:CHAD domain-containing protein
MPSKTPELELKFSAPADFAAGALTSQAGIEEIAELPALNLVALYYDTDDLRLARAGVTLRFRTGDDNGAAWTLKLPSLDTRELRDEVVIGQTNGTSIPDEARRLTTAFARGAELRKVARLRTRRRRWSLRETGGRELAELVDDRVSVFDGNRVTQRFHELEVEARSSDLAGLRRIEDALGQMGFAPTSQSPKVVRALGPRAADRSDIPEPAIGSPRSPVADASTAAISSAVRRLILHDPHTRLHDAEGIHQMRVSARRLRGYLRAFAPSIDPEWANGINDELKRLARALGNARDLDVMIKQLREVAFDGIAGITPMLHVMEGRRTTARRALDEELESDRYVGLLERLIEIPRTSVLSAEASEPCRSALPSLVSEAWQPLLDAVEELNEKPSDDRYHEVRIQAKRVRYIAEVAGPWLGRQAGRDADRFARHAEEVQNVLGERQDAVVMRQALLEEAAKRPQDGLFNLAAGRLVERQEQLIANCDKQFRDVWRAMNRKKIRAWLNG